jgi:hypothetical protein
MESHIDKKFYVPDISEFHVGFEYEHLPKRYLWFLNGLGPKDTWIKETFYAGAGDDGESEIYELDALIDDKAVRVKYIDREDIENTLCELKLEKNLSWRVGRCSDSFQEYVTEKHTILYGLRSLRVIIELLSSPNNNGGVVFCGDINNKSELKKILKMVGI